MLQVADLKEPCVKTWALGTLLSHIGRNRRKAAGSRLSLWRRIMRCCVVESPAEREPSVTSQELQGQAVTTTAEQSQMSRSLRLFVPSGFQAAHEAELDLFREDPHIRRRIRA